MTARTRPKSQHLNIARAVEKPELWPPLVQARDRTRFCKALRSWFQRHARPLPWRTDGDPYRIWISEMILQQTRVAQGLPYYERFLKAFPTVEKLAHAPLDDVLKLWEGLGYYARARYLHQAARKIVTEWGGLLPRSAREWQQLPGIGKYTAAAIASIACNEPVPLVDGNVQRVLTRLADIATPLEESQTQQRLYAIAERLLWRKDPGRWNQALMELGATVCLPRSPRCNECPVHTHCTAYRLGCVHQRPVRRPKGTPPHVTAVCAVVQKAGKYLLAQRPAHGLLAGLWEFPGGPARENETLEEAVERECFEKLGIVVTVGEKLGVVQHTYSHFRVTLHAYTCRHVSGKLRNSDYQCWRWVRPEEFSNFAIPKVHHKILFVLQNSTTGATLHKT